MRKREEKLEMQAQFLRSRDHGNDDKIDDSNGFGNLFCKLTYLIAL